jgi:hypothetical protein
VQLAIDEDGVFNWAKQGEIHKWLREHGFAHLYHFAIIGNPQTRVMVLDFPDSDHAMLCKLTWAEYVY